MVQFRFCRMDFLPFGHFDVGHGILDIFYGAVEVVGRLGEDVLALDIVSVYFVVWSLHFDTFEALEQLVVFEERLVQLPNKKFKL